MMEEWNDGIVEEWKNGRMEEWNDGKMEGWKNGRIGKSEFFGLRSAHWKIGTAMAICGKNGTLSVQPAEKSERKDN